MMSLEPEDDEGETRKGSDQVERVHPTVKKVLSAVDDSPLSEDDLLDLVAQMLPVSAEWESIGIGLRLQPRLLEQIAVEHSSPRERMVRVLTQWLKTNYNTERFGLPSWRNLSNVVAHPAAGNNPALALEIARKHPATDSSLPTSPTPPTSSGPGKEKVSTCLTLAEVEYEMREVTAADWFSLGVQLGIRPAKLREIEKDHSGDIWRCKFDLLEWWHRNAKEVSWNALAHALAKTGGYDTLAKRLRRKIDTYSHTEEHTSSETATVMRRRGLVDDFVDDIGPFRTMWCMVLCTSVTSSLLAVILPVLVSISLDVSKDLLADRPTQGEKTSDLFANNLQLTWI